MGCPVHGYFAGCRCGYAHHPVARFVALCVCALPFTASCAVLQSVTPADRAKAYESEASAVVLACKAYRFDRAAGLVADVPAMAELCK